MKKRALVVAMLAALTGAAHATDLTIGSSGSRVIVSWPQAPANDFYLQYATDLIPPIAWRPTADALADGGSWVVTNETAETSRSYRL